LCTWEHKGPSYAGSDNSKPYAVRSIIHDLPNDQTFLLYVAVERYIVLSTNGLSIKQFFYKILATILIKFVISE